MAQDGSTRVLYTLDHYRADMKIAVELDLGRQRAWKAAAAKRYKQTVLFHWLEQLEIAEGADLTPTLALHLVKGWTGRGIDRAILNKWFSRPGRTAADKSPDHPKQMDWIEKYKAQVVDDMKKAGRDMRAIRQSAWHEMARS
jgi:hypothetical protein